MLLPYCLCPLQCLMLMEILFGVDGLSQIKGNVLVYVSCFQLHLTGLVTDYMQL